ncbi:hypothetical protein [Flavilitoribacter nigricans]|uniref:Uncharacterized protein n=1 Tax=Flavilitoribacter nigricans (strain ATCC 23147 / DSM 23189 / NBRC 102662 / NCIMB 1420 / SS-2) TaxID=1122177 RepID=A0A2D0MWX6_FLAN2|nr:hypothetical protein [Flavilitoribacter nigricans]PHN00707.1 hypothetical protein CRP01_40860 [Flavilitoribacter nigricans DSM 23189 = NBRC 102662]
MRIFIIGSIDKKASAFPQFSKVCREIGLSLSEKTIDVLLCSPFDGSADKELILGFSSSRNQQANIELHYPQHENVESNWNELLGSAIDHNCIRIRKFRHPSPEKVTQEGWKNAWLFCQIQALNNASIIFTIGGNIDGSSNLLLRIAEAQGKPIIPLSSFGGAASSFLDRNKYELIDQLGNDQFKIIEQGTKFEQIAAIVTGFTNLKKLEHLKKYQQDPIFFISYPRDRPSEADYIEMLCEEEIISF